MRLAVSSEYKLRKARACSGRAMWIALWCAVMALGVLPALYVTAQDEGLRYFEETGHSVSGAFLRFYDQHGGRTIFGYPLTEQFEENGLLVQYFQRARMELHADGVGGTTVELGRLGEELKYGKPPISPADIPPPDHAGKFYFAETGHTVSFVFLDFYRENGGVDIFGYPITEWDIEPNGRIFQYFQRTKMEWYPENPFGRRVQLGMLGTIYVEQNVDPIYKEPVPPEILPSIAATTTVVSPVSTPEPTVGSLEVQNLWVRAMLRRPILGLGDRQTVYAYVIDQDNRGVPGASVEIEVQYQDGRVNQLSLEPTNANGYTQLEFGTESSTPGTAVIVNLRARYGDRVARTSTAFLQWW